MDNLPPFFRPLLPDARALTGPLQALLASGCLSNGGVQVQTLECQLAERASAAHAVAVSSATSGLLLSARALGWTSGEVLVPSFTFAASAHAVVWAGARPVFVDVDESGTMAPASVARMVGPSTVGIMAVTAYGLPCDHRAIAAAAPGVPILVDDAQGLGSRGEASGAVRARVVSLHATKTLVAGEGGVVFTDDPTLADRVRRLSNFGLGPDRCCAEIGLNAKMSEFSAFLALHSIHRLQASLDGRQCWAAAYREAFAGVSGLALQALPLDRTSCDQLFPLFIDAPRLGASPQVVASRLRAAGVPTARYFTPPLHRMPCYLDARQDHLPTTERLSDQVLCLPLWPDEPVERARAIADTLLSFVRGAQPA